MLEDRQEGQGGRYPASRMLRMWDRFFWGQIIEGVGGQGRRAGFVL